MHVLKRKSKVRHIYAGTYWHLEGTLHKSLCCYEVVPRWVDAPAHLPLCVRCELLSKKKEREATE